VFPTIWEKMNDAATTGTIYVVDEVAIELKRKDDGAFQWIDARESIIVPIDEDIQRIVTEIMRKYPKLVDTRKRKSGCDPWVIALAHARTLTVVTAERATGSLDRPKIPDVCGDMGIASIEVIEFLEDRDGASKVSLQCRGRR
jgi:hypothetical protein